MARNANGWKLCCFFMSRKTYSRTDQIGSLLDLVASVWGSVLIVIVVHSFSLGIGFDCCCRPIIERTLIPECF